MIYTNIFCTADNIVDLCKQVSLELLKFHNWFSMNKLSLNISKTNFMVFGEKHLNTIPPLRPMFGSQHGLKWES